MPWKNALPSVTARELLAAFIAHPLTPVMARWRLLRASGAAVAPAQIFPGVRLPGQKLTIGAGTFLNRGVTWDGHATLTIGTKCDIGHDVLFIGGTHRVGGSQRRAGARVDYPIVVGNGTWIGARTTILPGVTIGTGCIIGAGAVVTGDCGPNGMYAGVPARRIKDLD